MKPAASREPAVWFPTVRAGTGADVFTMRLAAALTKSGIRSEISWLPHHAEYVPWAVPIPTAPPWANVVHINSWLHHRFFESCGLPVVTTCHGCVHDPALEPYKSPLQSLYHRFWVKALEHRAYRSSSAVTAVSNYTANRTLDCFGRIPIEVIPNWLPDDAFVDVSRSKPHHPFRLLYVGKWTRRKGCDLFPTMMGRLGDAFELYFTGTAPESTKLPPNMTPLGWTSNPANIRTWMASADALLFPSRMEGMPLAVLEAMACGLPVICSDSASLPEVVLHNKTGLICRTDDIDDFVSAIRSLRENVKNWLLLKKAAREHAAAEFSEGKVISPYIRLYTSLLTTERCQAEPI